ncbi:TPA: hypothetical protein NJ265_000792 [Vibrio parahaemolyticus]|uniref:hypothetical protein n=1 Tax=Vibrio parahaemolyticus TaxID=670 RepID=UPI001120D9C8|nr:hypothetical protein [Vibrio parahaemolyticus]TOH06619.1 hypothetical protein CGI88_07130 [Vibrio parahaemolyticus]TOR04557.1 hypothetical protein CGG81_19340 [Vibrio parahaemolyticus]HCE1826252.1 hypothetical protein [Vibrio parahaemolyticus]HCE5184044.1 hypothetical protein [Vibrio parahaemolyticus]HCG5605195.1 hypothetical protein [Vibrio parahaemolyticus]
MYKQISLFQNDDGFTVNLSLANTRTPRKNTTFEQIATCKLIQRDSSVYSLLRSIAPKSESQAMSRRLKGMNITLSNVGMDNNHLFILDENTSFLFDIDMNEKSISLIKVHDRIFVDGDHDPLYRDFCNSIPKRVLPESLYNPCRLNLKERSMIDVIPRTDTKEVIQRLEEQDLIIQKLCNEVMTLKEQLSALSGLDINEVNTEPKRIPVESTIEVDCEVEEIELVIEENEIEALFEKEPEVEQQQIDKMINSLAINYNRDLLKAIKPLVEPEHIEYLEDIVKLLDKGLRLLPDRFTIEKITQFYPLMFCNENFQQTVDIITAEEYRLASAALAYKNWSEEEAQFEMLEV